jgi:plastocyanin
MHSTRITLAAATVAGILALSASRPLATPPASAPRTVDVQMIGDANGYRFSPASVTIKRGDRVRWTLVSGPPHNIVFWADSIPAGAATKLAASMPQSMGPLTGPFLMTPKQTYVVAFDKVPAGTYRYNCAPHLALGMVASVKVQ